MINIVGKILEKGKKSNSLETPVLAIVNGLNNESLSYKIKKDLIERKEDVKGLISEYIKTPGHNPVWVYQINRGMGN